MSPQEVLRELAALLEGLRGEAVLRLERPGSEHRWQIAGQADADEPAGTAEPVVGEMHRNILQAALEHPGKTFSGPQLAELTGYVYNGRSRRALSELRQWGLLSGDTGDPGYRATVTPRQLPEEHASPGEA
jgi:hypothetical protein